MATFLKCNASISNQILFVLRNMCEGRCASILDDIRMSMNEVLSDEGELVESVFFDFESNPESSLILVPPVCDVILCYFL